MAMIIGRGGLMDPLASFGNVWNEFDRMLQVVDQQTPQRAFAEDAKAIANTRVDWCETPDSHIIKAELPGLSKEDIKVQLEDNRILSICGERKKEEVRKDDTWHIVERSTGKFLRRFRVPENAKLDDICAKVENGVLTVTIPKAKTENPEAKPIDVAAHDAEAKSSSEGAGSQATDPAMQTGEATMKTGEAMMKTGEATMKTGEATMKPEESK